MATDLYGELGVSREASADEIKKAYRKLAAKLHPDKNPGDHRSESRFKAVNQAYQTLSDPERRALYDEFGEQSLREGFNAQAARAYQRAQQAGPGGSFGFGDLFSGGGGAAGFGDLLGDLLGNRRNGRARATMRGSDVASEVTVPFADALRGTELQLSLRDGSAPVTVRIPPGAADGDRLRVAGQGAPGPFGGPPGDLVLAIRVHPHPYFERRNLDLYLDLPITVAEAWRGTKVRVPTPDGPVTLTVPRRSQSGQVVRLKGRGVKRKKAVGDLYVRFLVRLPDTESKDVDKAVDDLERFTHADVRADIEL